VRLVLLLAWLTLLPTMRPLPVNSQMRAIVIRPECSVFRKEGATNGNRRFRQPLCFV
jgi:hypothetical protein